MSDEAKIPRRIGQYEIGTLIGMGGMGHVYRAHDTRLNRPVAIKFLSPDLADESARRRFQQEARAVSALNHPHILTVHDAGEFDGQQYLVTEFVDGGTLEDWAVETRSWRQIVELLIGVADGLAAAHGAGILHRDVKPANILISTSGYAKLADFGLAKLAQPTMSVATRTLSHTRPGAIVGTLAYMSPEQASGVALDARSDIFSLGVVLYELLAGRRPFRGDAESELLHAIVHATPETLPDAIPYELRLIVEKALEKDPRERYQTMRELVVDLKRVQRQSGATTRAGLRDTEPPKRWWRWTAVAALAVALVIGATVWRLWQQDYFWRNPLENARREQITDWPGTETDAVISPDGRNVVFYSDRDGPFHVWFTQPSSGDPINISKNRLNPDVAAGDGNLGANPRVGFSDDGQVWLTKLFPQEPGQPQRARTFLMPWTGETSRDFLERGMNPAWSPDRRRIAYFEPDPGDPIFIADPDGANPRQIFVDKRLGWHCHFVVWSPDGRFLYFTRGLIAINEFDIWRIRVPEGGAPPPEPERMTYHNARVGYLDWLDGRTLIYSATAANGTGQWLYALDVEHKIPHVVQDGVTERYLTVSVARTHPRRLLTTIAQSSASLWKVPLSDREQAEESDVEAFAVGRERALSPRVIADSLYFLSTAGDGDGLRKLENGRPSELWRAADGGVVAPPAISADGRQIAVSVRKEGRTRLYVMNSNGTNRRLLAESLDVRGAGSWSPDSRWIAVAASQGEGTRIFKVPVDGGPPVPLVGSGSYNPVWSPRDTFILYLEQGQAGYTLIKAVTPDGAPFPLPKGFEEIQVNAEGSPFRFVPNQDAIVYVFGKTTHGGNFHWADLNTGLSRQLTNLKQGFGIASFDVTPDGRTIIFDRLQEHADVWLMELKD